MKDPKPVGSFERTYASEREELIATAQRVGQSSHVQVENKRKEIQKKSQLVIDAYHQDEEGLNNDEDAFDEKKFAKELR